MKMDNQKELFLSDVLNTSLFETGYMNVIVAPCGCGKTTAAINSIASLASKPQKAIYLIDTRIGKERLALNPALTTPYFAYADSIVYKDGFFENMEFVGVATYAQFGNWCARFPRFAENYEVIVCDEPHNLVSFSEMGIIDDGDVPLHKIAREAICEAVNQGKTLVVGITATPNPLRKLACPLNQISIDTSKLHHFVERETIHYRSINSILTQIPPGKRGGMYIKHVKKMIEYGEILRKRGFNPLLLWSLNYELKMSPKQLIARQYIIENEAVPDEYDIFIFNATAETSINIYSKMDFFIAHNTEDTHIIQSRGRYRGDLDTLYVYDCKNGGAIVVPEEYLEHPLFREDMNRLRDFLDIKKDNHGNRLSIENMVKLISDCGYSYEQKEIKRRKCWIIHKE